MPINASEFRPSLYASRDGVCLAFPNDLVAAHNVALEGLVGILRKNLTESTILLMRSDKILSEVEQNPAKNGFLDTKAACCGSGLFNGGTACGQGNFTVCPPVRNTAFDT